MFVDCGIYCFIGFWKSLTILGSTVLIAVTPDVMRLRVISAFVGVRHYIIHAPFTILLFQIPACNKDYAVSVNRPFVLRSLMTSTETGALEL